MRRDQRPMRGLVLGQLRQVHQHRLRRAEHDGARQRRRAGIAGRQIVGRPVLANRLDATRLRVGDGDQPQIDQPPVMREPDRIGWIEREARGRQSERRRLAAHPRLHQRAAAAPLGLLGRHRHRKALGGDPRRVHGDAARLNGNAGNVQSALLAEVRGHLQRTYPQSTIRGDGQVVLVAFNTVAVEVVPVFLYDGNRGYVMPDTNRGGRWKLVDPLAEIYLLEAADAGSRGNARAMARMLKVWKRECNVPLKSYQIELLAAEFVGTYEYREKDWYYYDWFMRDFFSWLCLQAHRNLIIPGTGEVVNLGSEWLSRAETARGRALTACGYEWNDWTILAGEEWQKIFGNRIPIHVT